MCLLWRSDVKVEVIKFNKHLIAAKVSDSVCDWCFIGFNGPPYVGKKKKKKREKRKEKESTGKSKWLAGNHSWSLDMYGRFQSDQ